MNEVSSPIRETEIMEPSRNAVRLKLARQWHLCLGTFFAPSILFFALTGSLQLFSLHESHPGETYQAPAWIQKLASIHKDQTVSEKHGPPPGFAGRQKESAESEQVRRPPESEGGHRNEERGENKLTLALKVFFLAMALGLVFSTSLGIYMAFKYNRSRALVWTMLLFGAAIPIALIVLMT